MSRELYEELHEELTQELTEERYKELRKKAQKLFFDLFFIGIDIDNKPNLDNRGLKRGFFRVLTTNKDFEYLVRDSPAKTLGPPDERVMMIFKSYFDDRIGMNETYKQFDLNQGIVKFLVNNLGLNGTETKHLWEIIYYSLRVKEEHKKKLDEEYKKSFAGFDDTPLMLLSSRQPRNRDYSLNNKAFRGLNPRKEWLAKLGTPNAINPWENSALALATAPPSYSQFGRITPQPYAAIDAVAPASAPARDAVAPASAPASAPARDAVALSHAAGLRAYQNSNDDDWAEFGGRRRRKSRRKSRKSRKSSNKKRKQRKTKRRRQ